MYSPPSSTKKQLIIQVAIYTLMTLSVVILVTILVLTMIGYRFDRKAGTLEQGGLVQLNSIPSGANLTIDSRRLSATTSTKTTLAPGTHTITMARNGYTPWQKTVDVRSGRILWLNYARLIPTDRPVDTVATLPAITSSMPSPNQKWYAMTTEKASPAIRLVNIDNDTPQIETLALPETSYTKPADKGSSGFYVSAWDSSSRYILLEHRYDKKIEWIVVDIENITEAKNVTNLFDITMSDPQFGSGGSTLYALINGDVRRIDIEGATISAPLVRDVAEFSLFDEEMLLYVTNIDKETKSRSIGYRQDNASKPRAIRSYSDDGQVPLHVSLGRYYSQTYVGIAYGTTVDILSGSLPRSDSDDPLSLTAVATMSTTEPVDFFSNRTAGRFFVAQHSNSYSVYDLELQKATTTTVRGKGKLTAELRWIDGHILWSGLDNVLRFYEFDGANQNDIMPIVFGQNPALTSNNRFIYAPTVNEEGVFHLSRVRLIL